MAYEFYVQIQGESQGAFKGESIRKEHKDKIAGIAFEYEVTSPRDPASGLPSGKRHHKPLTFTKEWGAASPQIFHALCTNELLPEVLFEFYHTTPQGAEEVHYTIKLVNASIASVKPFIHQTRHEQRTDLHELEQISLTFQRIEIESKTGQTMAVDDWVGEE